MAKSGASLKLSAKGVGCSSKSIENFYRIYECVGFDRYSFKCDVMHKQTGQLTTWTISPVADNTNPGAIHYNYAVVALGTKIYMIVVFATLLYALGLTDPTTMLRSGSSTPSGHKTGGTKSLRCGVPRHCPGAVVVDGKIYVFGGAPDDDGEFFDPEKDDHEWHPVSATGFRPYFPCIQAPYVDPHGVKSVLAHSDMVDGETLQAYRWDTREWEVASRDFSRCLDPGAIVGDIIYTVFKQEEEEEDDLLRGYHLIRKEWFRVKLPPRTKICTSEIGGVFASGSDKLCLMWYHVKARRMECVELKLHTSYSYTGSRLMFNITATIEFHTFFHMQPTSCRKCVLHF